MFSSSLMDVDVTVAVEVILSFVVVVVSGELMFNEHVVLNLRFLFDLLPLLRCFFLHLLLLLLC